MTRIKESRKYFHLFYFLEYDLHMRPCTAAVCYHMQQAHPWKQIATVHRSSAEQDCESTS